MLPFVNVCSMKISDFSIDKKLVQLHSILKLLSIGKALSFYNISLIIKFTFFLDITDRLLQRFIFLLLLL